MSGKVTLLLKAQQQAFQVGESIKLKVDHENLKPHITKCRGL